MHRQSSLSAPFTRPRALAPRRLLAHTLAAALVFTQAACAQVRRSGAPSTTAPPIQIPPPPTGSPALDVPLKISRRPASAGVPLAESANVRDVNRIALVDAAGKAVPAQFRALARWRGTADDAGRPVKWLLVDTDAAPGDYTLTIGNNPAPPAGVSGDLAALGGNGGATQAAPARADSNTSTNNTGKLQGGFQIEAGRVRLRAATTGAALLSSLQLDGAEQLSQPVTLTLEQPRAVLLVGDAEAGSGDLRVNDAAPLEPGMSVKFEHVGQLPFEMQAGITKFGGRESDRMHLAGRTYRLAEGTPREEDVYAAREENGSLYARTPLRFTHPARTRIRDLGAEAETATVRAVRGQTVILDRPLRQKHGAGERVVAVTQAEPLVLRAHVEEARVEERGPLRLVFRQDGHFRRAGGKDAEGPLRFTLRYHVYARSPFVRAQLRVVNTGPFGFGGWRNERPPYSQPALVRALTLDVPTAAGAAGTRVQRVEARGPLDQRVATVSAGAAGRGGLEVTAPEFAENFPKRLAADSSSIYFEVLPRGLGDAVGDYVFDGARAKTTEFYFGLETRAAAAATNSLGVTLAPAYVVSTRAVRPALVEKREWMKALTADRTVAVAATRLERWLAGAYAREANEQHERYPGQSAFEVRRLSRDGQPEEDNGHFGWRNFGDLAWADGYSNVHYDLPYILLREYARTADARAFQLGSEMARYRADWGQHQADDYWDKDRTSNLRGMAFYEKGDHGTYREPVPSHNWSEGLWLYWALTGDEGVRESAVAAAQALLNHPDWSYEFGLNWNESRWYGWPVLGLVAAWRYSGDVQYLKRAQWIVYMMVRAEEGYGRKGYFIPAGSHNGRIVQPFMWSGYTQLGTIEYWRETGDRRVADFLVRVADWLIGKGGERPALLGGVSKPNGDYQPLGTAPEWSPDKPELDQPAVAYGMMSVPVLTVAARITGRADLRQRARQLFRDATYYRDTPDNASVNAASLSTINFRSTHFGGSAPKVYGQFGLFVPEYLADYVLNEPPR
jgi:hypothetical protein